jgi:hydrogenase expression/formation protein HypE
MNDEFQLQCPVPLRDHPTVQMAHGGGGRFMRQLIESMFLPAFAECSSGTQGATAALSGSVDGTVGQAGHHAKHGHGTHEMPAHDSAVLEVGGMRLAFTTDTFVVSPMFFPGGDIGKLAVYGTVNDLAMSGAKPLYLSAGFVLEEGLAMETLQRVVASMAAAAREVGVQIVTGDTKVVDRGKGDGIFINTAGIGLVPRDVEISPAKVQPGDVIIVSGDLGRHGMAVMSVREGLGFEGNLQSDCASLAGLVEAMLAADRTIHCLRDLTRGGLAAALNEIAADARVGIELDESAIAVSEPVASACEILGLDPLYVANEGRLVAFVPMDIADKILQAMKKYLIGSGGTAGQASSGTQIPPGPAIIGKTTREHAGTVVLRGLLGSGRIVDLLSGEQLPRIC